MLFMVYVSSANAASWDLDYTLIDCINWDNNSGVVFDSTKPYATLKVWIENTISHINENINKTWNEKTASWQIFNIKIACSFDDFLNKEIGLDFNWVAYDNELIIEGIENNSFIIKNTSFKLWHKAWNITFKNAKFLNENKPYFYDFIFPEDRLKRNPESNWVKIIDSYIKLKNQNIGTNVSYKVFDYTYYPWYGMRAINYFNTFDNYSNKQIIENSVLDIEIDDDFSFRIPSILKNSKINFINTTGTWSFDINFLEDWNIKNNKELNFGVFISNEINFWWNEVLIEDTSKIAFINNKITSFSDFYLWKEVVYINNYIENNTSNNISDFKNLFNNIFKSGFTDSYDIFNYRKNYSSNNIGSKWLWWIYRKLNKNKYFDISVDSSSLYKEITWKDLWTWLWDIYIIFNY